MFNLDIYPLLIRGGSIGLNGFLYQCTKISKLYRYVGNMKMTFQTVKAVENRLLITLPVKENITAGIVDGYFALIVSLSQFQAVLKDAVPEFVM